MKKICALFPVLLLAVGIMSAQDPKWDWVRGLRSGNRETATSVESDPRTGVIYLAGEWTGDLAGPFLPGPTESTDLTATYGGMDGLVAKFDPEGNPVWAFKVGGESDDLISDIHLDHEGNIYITGSLGQGSVSLNGTGLPSADADFTVVSPALCFLAKYDPDGAFLWFRWGESLDAAAGTAITSNQKGVYLTGHHRGDILFGGLPTYTPLGGNEVFIVCYTFDGAEQWHVSAGSEGDDFGETIICDDENLYVGGRFGGSLLNFMDISGKIVPVTENTAEGQSDAFVAAFTIDGVHLWSGIISSAGEDACRGMALDPDHVFLAGTIGQEAKFPLYPDNPVGYKGGIDAFVCSIGRADGAARWVRTITGDADGDQEVTDLSRDESGALYLTGSFSTNVAVTDGLNDSKGLEDVFLASYSRSGAEKWLITAGSTGRDAGNAVCASTPSVIYLAGEYTDDFSAGSVVTPADGDLNIFLARLNLDCVDAVGGKLSAPDTLIAEGESFSLVLKDYYGDIRWEFSLPGMNNWTLLTADLSDSIQIFPGGTADYRAFVTSGSCAPDSSNVVRVYVENANARFADAGEDVWICPGDSVQLKASGGDFYKWEPADTIDIPDIPDPWVKPPDTTTYVVHVTRADGLTDSDTVTVFLYTRPRVNAGPDLHVCEGDQVQLSAEGEGDIHWFPAGMFTDPTLSEQVVTVFKTTPFRVVISDVNGCLGTDRVVVFTTKPPVVCAGTDKKLIAVFETRMEATLGPGEHGTWVLESGSGIPEDPEAPDTRVTGLEYGENVFSWIVSNDTCPPEKDFVKIVVEDFLFPTVITPNGDGRNDCYYVKGIEQFGESELLVLNRWGEEVFSSRGPYMNNWYGTNSNGNELPEDTYYVILNISAERSWKGYLVIIR